MTENHWRLWKTGLVVMGILVLWTAEAVAQAKKQPQPNKQSPSSTQSQSTKAPASSPFQEAVARAKKSNQPLVIFGVSEGCVRCAALKEGLTTQPEIKELMAQYVSAEIPFGGKEFSTVYSDIIQHDAKYNQPIGAPSVFIFTAKGDVVYAGPNDPSGMQPGDAFKKLLREGIDKNGTTKATRKPAK